MTNRTKELEAAMLRNKSATQIHKAMTILTAAAERETPTDRALGAMDEALRQHRREWRAAQERGAIIRQQVVNGEHPQ